MKKPNPFNLAYAQARKEGKSMREAVRIAQEKTGIKPGAKK